MNYSFPYTIEILHCFFYYGLHMQKFNFTLSEKCKQTLRNLATYVS